MDFRSLHDSTPRASRWHDEAILHEVFHPWRRASSTLAADRGLLLFLLRATGGGASSASCCRAFCDCNSACLRAAAAAALAASARSSLLRSSSWRRNWVSCRRALWASFSGWGIGVTCYKRVTRAAISRTVQAHCTSNNQAACWRRTRGFNTDGPAATAGQSVDENERRNNG